jgi:hypothetical protein
VYSCFGILNISFLPFRHPIDLLMEDEIAGEAQNSSRDLHDVFAIMEELSSHTFGGTSQYFLILSFCQRYLPLLQTLI